MPHFHASFLHPRFQLDACIEAASLDDVLRERETRVAQREALRNQLRQSPSERETEAAQREAWREQLCRGDSLSSAISGPSNSARAANYSLLSFSLNLAGPHKRGPLADFFFAAALTLLVDELSRRFGKLKEPLIRAGRAGAWALLEVPTDAQSCKAFCLELEDGLPAGLLWDLDVYVPETGQKLSRSTLGWAERPCLICGRKVSFCARSRAHSWQELERESRRLMKESLLSVAADALWLAAEKSLFYEALATPKAGLVDRLDPGAHSDMDIYSFVDSSLALGPSLRKFIEAGMASSVNRDNSDKIGTFKTLAVLGQQAERSMFRASGGVNTQQGLIFSLGFLLFAAGQRLRERVEALDRAFEQRESEELHQDVTQALFPTATELATEASVLATAFLDWRGDSKESRQRGARAAVLSGYRESLSALTILRRERAEGGDEDESSLAALLYLMSRIEDSNILRRAALRQHARAQNELCQMQKRAAEILNLPRKERAGACCLWNQELCRKGLSPGGAADQLALTRFFDFLEVE